MPPRLRKAVLTAHVATSVGWLGAVVGYLVLDITTVTGSDPETVRGAYLGMSLIVRYAILPLALTTVLIGVVNALGTPWGLVRHYWVVVKLLLTLVGTVILVQEVSTVEHLAGLATASDPRPLANTLPHSGGGLLVLLVTLVLSIYKPRGVTRYGWRKQSRAARPGKVPATS